MRDRCWLSPFSLLLVGGICCASAAAEEKPKWPAFPPAMEKDVRWQTLPREYSDVFLDHQQRPWFFLHDGYRYCFSNKEFSYSTKNRITCLVSPELPQEFIEIPYKNHLLGFDRQGRFWEIGKYGLLASNPFKGEFLQHYPLEPIDLAKLNQDFLPLPFLPFKFEHSSGRIYFLGYEGIYILDEKEEWLVKRFSRKLVDWDDLRYRPAALGAAEGPDGRFYLWCRQLGKLDALFVHAGEDNWTVLTYEQEPRLKDVAEIVPLPDGAVEMQNQTGRRFPLPQLTQTPTANIAATAQAISYRPAWYGLNAALATDGPLSVYGQIKGTDAQGRIYIRTHGEPNVGGESRRVMIFDPRQPETEEKLVVEPIPVEASGRRLTVIDTERHVWARLDLTKFPFLSRFENGAWTHFPAPPGVIVPAADEKNPRELFSHPSYDWVMRPLTADRDWKADGPAAYEALPALANVALLQPIDDGGLIAVERGGGRSYLYADQKWRVYESQQQLIESNYELLRSKLNNSVNTYDIKEFDFSQLRWGRDALGRIWVPPTVKPTQAYDGRKWEEQPCLSFVFNADGTRCYTDKFLYDTSVNPPGVVSALPLEQNQIERTFVQLAGAKKIWHVGNKLPNGASLDPDFLRTFAFQHGPVLQDSSQRYWFRDTNQIYLVRSDGMVTKFVYPTAFFHDVLAEQGPEIFWALANDALLRLRVKDTPGEKLAVELLTRYPRIVPQGAVNWMFIDAEGALWLACPRGETPLCRIQLPSLDSAKP